MGPGPGRAELAGCGRVILISPQSPCDYLAQDDDSSSLVELRRGGLALALVRAPCDYRVPADEEDLADFETDVGARADMPDRRCGESGPTGASGFVLAGRCRVAAGCCIGQRPAVASGRPVTLGRYEGRLRGYVDRHHHAG